MYLIIGREEKLAHYGNTKYAYVCYPNFPSLSTAKADTNTMWKKVKDKVGSPKRSSGSAVEESSSSSSKKKDDGKKSLRKKKKRDKGVTFDSKGDELPTAKSPEQSATGAAKAGVEKSGNEGEKNMPPTKIADTTRDKMQINHLDVLAAEITTVAMTNAGLGLKRQMQKKCLRSDARAIVWKCIANAALGISIN